VASRRYPFGYPSHTQPQAGDLGCGLAGFKQPFVDQVLLVHFPGIM
jgi:hypothetical protein